ncbi:MAG: SRPBCC family protein [Candidatus Nanopelagicales bacterium]|jgi:uncharacterized protein YndB with AHSA1/START domain|nr:SRPBCC family protein [Candidatus Nanopelagicales bacterium]
MASSETTASSTIEIAAPPEHVYDLVVDVARMGEWSPESTGTIGSPGAVETGDHFWGLNRKGVFRWFTRCTVLEAERGQRFVFDVDFPPSPVARWTYEFRATDTGCEVTESWEDRRFGPLAGPIKWFGGIVIPGPRAAHNQRNIETSLRALKAAAEG